MFEHKTNWWWIYSTVLRILHVAYDSTLTVKPYSVLSLEILVASDFVVVVGHMAVIGDITGRRRLWTTLPYLYNYNWLVPKHIKHNKVYEYCANVFSDPEIPRITVKTEIWRTLWLIKLSYLCQDTFYTWYKRVSSWHCQFWYDIDIAQSVVITWHSQAFVLSFSMASAILDVP